MCQERKNRWKTISANLQLYGFYTSSPCDELYWWINKGSRIQLSKKKKKRTARCRTKNQVLFLPQFRFFSLRYCTACWELRVKGRFVRTEDNWGSSVSPTTGQPPAPRRSSVGLPSSSLSSAKLTGQRRRRNPPQCEKKFRARKNPSRKAPAGKEPGEETGRAY